MASKNAMNRQENSSEGRRQIVRRETPSASTYVGGNTETVLIDLIIEILSRLPAKSIAICRCVSKLWGSLLSHSDFTESFLTRSSARPRILFTLEFEGKWHFFSSPQPHEEGLCVVEADYHMGFSGDWYKQICLPAHGFFYLMSTDRVPVICNPCTGQQLTLPKARAKNNDLRSFFGYDPIDKQLKVLCMTVTNYKNQVNSKEHQVLTLGRGGQLSWRKIKCLFPHYPEKESNGVCINGVLYYIARSNDNRTHLVACFDVRSEKFSLIEMTKGSDFTFISGLMNYKGKLGVLMYVYGSPGELWVIDDYKKEELSKRVFSLPSTGIEVVKWICATDTGEIVWVRSRSTYPFYVSYYNLETKSSRRVLIKDIEDKLINGRPEAHFTFPNYVENVMFLS